MRQIVRNEMGLQGVLDRWYISDICHESATIVKSSAGRTYFINWLFDNRQMFSSTFVTLCAKFVLFQQINNLIYKHIQSLVQKNNEMTRVKYSVIENQ